MSADDDRAGRHGRHRGDIGPTNSRHAVRRTVQVVAAVLSALLFVGFGYGFYNYNNLTSNQHKIEIGGLGASTPTPGASNTTVQHVNGSAENILIVGLDSRAGLTNKQKRYYKVGLSDESTSTDTIIVVHVPANGKKATLLSIPRDTYVTIPGHPSNKINAAYIDGYMYGGGTTTDQDEANGASLLVQTVKNLTGLQIDHYVQVGFSGFVNIVKAIGSVPIDLCQSVDDTYQHNRAIGGSGGSGFKMTAGPHDLTPQQALEFVRQRHNIPGPVTDDLGREARQRYFLKQAFNKIATAGVLLNPFKLKHLISAVDSAFTFDNNNFGILQFAEQMSQLTAGNISGKSIPTTGDSVIGGQDVLTADTSAVHAFAHRLFYGTHHHSSAPKTGPKTGTKKKATGGDPAASGCIY